MSNHAQLFNIAEQASDAKQAGVNEIARLLQNPEDLSYLPALRAECEAKHKSNQAQLSATVYAQVEAAKLGLELLEKSHRHVMKLRSSFGQLDKLTSECISLIDNHPKIKALSMAHVNVGKVLGEMEDIIDLPVRATMVEEMMEDENNMLMAYEGLTVLDGTSCNAKAVWQRNLKKSTDINDLSQYLNKVSETLAKFEGKLWTIIREYDVNAKHSPHLLVNALRVVELQQHIDQHSVQAKWDHNRPKYWKDRCFKEIEKSVQDKFKFAMTTAEQCGEPNHHIKKDQYGNVIVSEERDAFGRLTKLVKLDAGGNVVTITDNSMHALETTEEPVFNDDAWLVVLLDEMNRLLGDLTDTFDYVAPCFPPNYNIFDQIQQHYHVRFARLMDTIGRKCDSITSKNILELLKWTEQYAAFLRGLGVDEELCHLPLSPDANAEEAGMKIMLDLYTHRMEETVRKWFKNILAADMAGKVAQRTEGTLYTPGAMDFFRILNEEVSIMEQVARGEVLLEAAQSSLKIMSEFVEALLQIVRKDRLDLHEQTTELEFLCAVVNNCLECYDQSLDYAEHVQDMLAAEYKDKLEIEETCRMFLDVAKTGGKRIVDVIFRDPGMEAMLKELYKRDWLLEGATMNVIVETLRDYFQDLHMFLVPSFFRRVVEASLEDLVGRCMNVFMGNMPERINQEVVARMAADEAAITDFYRTYLKESKVAKYVGQMSEIRELSTASDVEAFVLAYSNILQVNPAITPDMVKMLCQARPDMQRQDIAEVIQQCKEMYTQRRKALQQEVGEEQKGFWAKLFGRKEG